METEPNAEAGQATTEVGHRSDFLSMLRCLEVNIRFHPVASEIVYFFQCDVWKPLLPPFNTAWEAKKVHPPKLLKTIELTAIKHLSACALSFCIFFSSVLNICGTVMLESHILPANRKPIHSPVLPLIVRSFSDQPRTNTSINATTCRTIDVSGSLRASGR